jgi:hypothetical protein
MMSDDPASAAPETLASAPNVVLGDQPVEVSLKIRGGARRLASRPGGEKLYLVLRDAQAAQPPGTLYRVSVGPRGEVIGSVNFFNAEPSRPRDYSFEVTDVLQGLRNEQILTDTLKLTIGPSGHPDSDVKPTIGEVTLVSQ